MQSIKGRLTVLIGAAALIILMMAGMSGLAKSAKKPQHYHEPDGSFASLRYPYRQLDAKSKELYLALYQGISAYQKNIALPGTYTAEEYRNVYLLLTTQEPELFYLDTVYETAAEMQTAEMYYTMSREEAEQMKSEMEFAADSVLSRITGSRTEIQRLLAIHDRICEECTYAKTPYSDSAYGCLAQGSALCEGYAKAFLYVSRRAGIDVMCVPGMTDKGEAHIWNIASVNGAYYNIDVTWDDDEAYLGRTAHTCFAVPDSVFGDHIPDLTLLSPPACTDTTHTYYQERGFLLTDSNLLSDSLRRWNGAVPERIIEFRCADSNVYENAKNLLRTDAAVHAVLEGITFGASPRIIADEKRSVVVILT